MEHKQEIIKSDATESISQSYADATWLRTMITVISGGVGVAAAGPIGVGAAAIAAVPAFASAVDQVMTAKAQKISERRLNELCTEWQSQMEKISDNVVDKDYVVSEEFFDLVFKAWEATKRTRHNEKIRLYARVLTGAVRFQNHQEYSPEDYLSILEELSPLEIEIASALYQVQKDYPNQDENLMQWLQRVQRDEWGGTDECSPASTQLMILMRKCPSLSPVNDEFSLLRLQRCGLVNELSGAYTDYTGGAFVITEMLRSLMKFLEKNPI